MLIESGYLTHVWLMIAELWACVGL